METANAHEGPLGWVAPTAEQLRKELPGATDIIGDQGEYVWASEANAERAADALEAARSAEALGYPHHVEMHLRRAMEILREDQAASHD